VAVTVASNGSLVSGTGILSLPWPSHQTGDIGVILQFFTMTSASAAWPSVPTGWEVVPNAANNPVATNRTRLLWKRAASGSEATVSVPAGTGITLHAVRMAVLRGCVAEGVPFEYGSKSSNQGLGVGVHVGGVASYQDGALVLMGAGQTNDSTTGIFSAWNIPNVTPEDMTELFDSGTTTGNGACLGLATRAVTKDEAVGGMRMTSSAGIAYAYEVGTIAVPGPPNGMAPAEVASGSGTTTSKVLTIPAGAASPGDLIVVTAELGATAARTISFTGATAIGSTQSYPAQANTYYTRIGWAIATGESQTITITASGTISSGYYYAYRITNLADAAVTDGGSTNGTGASDVVLPDSPSCTFALHFVNVGTTSTSTPIAAFTAPVGWVSEPLAKSNNYSSFGTIMTKGGLSKSVKGTSFPVTNDTKWVVHSMFVNGTPVGGGGGGGASHALFWGNNF
jgi:hypothetical protein